MKSVYSLNVKWMNWEIIGLVAAVITTAGFMPQIMKGYRTKSLQDLSYWLNVLLGSGMLLWLVYGYAIGSFAVVVANIVGVTLNVTLIVMKYHYSKREGKSG
jgi:MtN3 and saliva related transmembrane protein